MYFISNLSLIILWKKLKNHLKNHYGFINITACNWMISQGRNFKAKITLFL